MFILQSLCFTLPRNPVVARYCCHLFGNIAVDNSACARHGTQTWGCCSPGRAAGSEKVGGAGCVAVMLRMLKDHEDTALEECVVWALSNVTWNSGAYSRSENVWMLLVL